LPREFQRISSSREQSGNRPGNPKAVHIERREIMRLLLELEQDGQTLAECDRLALERFQMLDAMELEDEANPSR
jgi:hypothetical protein